MEKPLYQSYRLSRNTWHWLRERSWKQKRMEADKNDIYRRRLTTLQTMINNNRITPEDQLTPICTLKAIHAQDWIRLQDPTTLTYETLLNHCKLLEQWCKQFQKAQQKGRADLTSLVATSTSSSIHQDSITTYQNCYRCRYSHLRNNCPVTGQQCHKCNGIGHFSALCRTRTHTYR